MKIVRKKNIAGLIMEEERNEKKRKWKMEIGKRTHLIELRKKRSANNRERKWR